MDFIHLTSESEIRDLICWHNAHSEYVVLDFETTDRDPRQAKLVDIQMTGRHEDQAVFFSGEFLPLLKGLQSTQVGQNWIRYDWKVAHRHGVDLRTSTVRDTMLMHHLVDENAEHGLDAWVQEHYGDTYKADFWGKYENYQEAPLADRLAYGGADIVYTGRFYRWLNRRLVEESIPASLVDHVHRLASALLDTEIRGIRVDLDYTIAMGAELKLDIAKTEIELREMGGVSCEAIEMDLWLKEMAKRKTDKGKAGVPRPEFSFTSSQQVMALLYQELKLPVQTNAKTKKPTVDDAALDELEPLHPLIPKLRQLRKYSKMYGAFIEGILSRTEAPPSKYLAQGDCSGNRIYPSFNINGTATGRISHSEPNMGQMPAKGEWAKIRGIFVPEDGHKLISCDYGQLEVCIAAHFSQDKNLLKIINEGASQHDITSESLQIPRNAAKTLNFAMQYLCSPFKVADLLGCTRKDAEGVWRRYWDTYSGLKRFIDETISTLENGNQVATPFGRRRRFPGYKRPTWANPEKGLYTKEMRQAFNAVIQGTGADITSRAAYLVDEELKKRGIGKLWFTVHDELIAEVQEDKAELAREIIQGTMVGVGREIGLKVPLTVDCSQPLSRWEK